VSGTDTGHGTADQPTVKPQSFIRLVLYITLPLVLLFLAGAWLITSDPLRLFDSGAPPVENLTIEQVFLDDEGIHVKGDEPMTIAQVQVDDAYWAFTQTPAGPLTRVSSAWLKIPYPWVQGEAHVIRLVTNTGATFEHEIAIAVGAPKGQTGSLRIQALVGGFVGILPVAIGMMFFPLMRTMGRDGMRFFLALTVGMLAFLLIDTVEAALKFAGQASPAFQGTALVLLVAGMTCLGLIALGRRKGTPSGLALATYVAFGIGLHNFGEGLAIGTALAAGSAVHNLTEGIAIAAPLVKKKPSLLIFAGLVLLAGAPAIPGIWLGSYAIAPQWAAFAMAIATGAILQVLFEVGSYSMRSEKDGRLNLDRYALGGILFGVGFMYLTAMAIKI